MSLNNNAKAKNATKLTQRAKRFVLQQLAEFYDVKEIQSELKEQFGIEVTYHSIDYYRRRYCEDINKKRSEWLADIGSVPVSNKRVRLLELQRALNMVKDGYTKQVVTKDGKVVSIHVFDPQAIIRILEQARKETEKLDEEKVYGNAITNTGDGTINVFNPNVKDMTDEELDAAHQAVEEQLRELGFVRVDKQPFSDN